MRLSISDTIVTCRGVRVTTITGSSSDDWIYWQLGYTLLITLKYSAIADLHDFQFTVAHALGSSVFTSRVLATVFNAETSTSNTHRYTDRMVIA
jgi:hypothetical protein